MEEITQKQNEISIMEIFRLLLSKLKYIILVVILGAALGAGFGFLRTHNVEYYGTEIKFYINPQKDKDTSVNSESQYGVYGAYGKNVLNNMVELLESQSFAELLLLNEKGLPTQERLDFLANNDLNALVQTATVAVDAYNAKYASMETALATLNLANELVSTKTAELDKLWTAARLENPALPSTPTAGLTNTTIDNAISALSQATVAQVQAQQTYANLYKEVASLATQADNAKKPALDLWRELDKNYYTTNLNKISSASTFSYYDAKTDASSEDLARSFIYVKISVLNDKEYAEDLRELLIKAVPEYIIEKMPVPSGYISTNCIRISRTDGVYRTNSDVAKPTAIKKGLLFGAAFFVVACVIVIFVDRSDKRLRSIEQITDIFNVPVLGVIPTFKDSERADNQTSSKADEPAKEEEDNKDETEVQS